MHEDSFIEHLASLVGNVPDKLPLISLRQSGAHESEQRLNLFLKSVAECAGISDGRQETLRLRDRTLLRLPGGAQAMAFHASGALAFRSGTEPMRKLFAGIPAEEVLSRQIERVAGQLDLRRWVAREESLDFERLWKIKAAAADRHGTISDPVLCRAIGAYRHHVDGFPILGTASAVVQLNGEGELDAVRVNARTTGDRLQQVAVSRPIDAAVRAVRHVSGSMSRSERRFADVAEPTAFTFGYFSLSRRKVQNLFAPAYVATFRTRGPESVNHLVVVSGGDADYLRIDQSGADPAVLRNRGEANTSA